MSWCAWRPSQIAGVARSTSTESHVSEASFDRGKDECEIHAKTRERPQECMRIGVWWKCLPRRKALRSSSQLGGRLWAWAVNYSYYLNVQAPSPHKWKWSASQKSCENLGRGWKQTGNQTDDEECVENELMDPVASGQVTETVEWVDSERIKTNDLYKHLDKPSGAGVEGGEDDCEGNANVRKGSSCV